MSEDDPLRPRRNPRQRPDNVRRPGEPPPADPAAPVRARPNPRAEMANRRLRNAAPPPDMPAEAPVRPRRNPRDKTASRQIGAAPSTRPESDPILRIEQPAGYVLAVLDLDGAGLARGDRDILGAARLLSDEMGLAVAALICGPATEALQEAAGAWGADRIVPLADPALADSLVAHRIDAAIAVIAMLEASHVLFGDTAMGGEFGRRVAARLGDRPVIGAIRLSAQSVTYIGDAGRSEISGAPPRIIVLRPDSFDPVACAPRREARILTAPAISVRSELEDLGLLPVDPASVPLAEADLIVSAGNGVSDWQGFHDLALALGAAEAGSRVVVDAGYMPRDRQVGASGLLVAPRCYIALGISGASQHLDGILDCPRVVAVNNDPHADIIKRADLAVIGDVQAIMPALARQVRGRI